MMNVLKAIDDAINSVLIPNGGAYVESMNEARDVVAKLIEALKAYDRWNYESRSARATGESVYSFADFQEMRDRAETLGAAAIARATQGDPTNGK